MDKGIVLDILRQLRCVYFSPSSNSISWHFKFDTAFPGLQIDYQDLIILENKPSVEFTTILFQTRMWLRFWVCLNIVSKCNDCASNTSCLLPTAPAHPDYSGCHATPLFVPYRSTLFADVPNHRQSLFSTHHNQLCMLPRKLKKGQFHLGVFTRRKVVCRILTAMSPDRQTDSVQCSWVFLSVTCIHPCLAEAKWFWNLTPKWRVLVCVSV